MKAYRLILTITVKQHLICHPVPSPAHLTAPLALQQSTAPFRQVIQLFAYAQVATKLSP